ncbi:extracellular calcium-sensing receptor-like [Pyxicephalus adspersus]|uniref:extracellular calcium-sensing receptor-like n=1 Tax=Pyxicephalus adspersus TaxID=30357 RepID=UPI003B595680
MIVEFFIYFSILSLCISFVHPLSCTLRSPSEIGYFQDGDILIGGFFPVRTSWKDQRYSFTEQDQPITCTSLSPMCYSWMQAMIYAIKEINADDLLLPNITLGFQIFDTCTHTARALRGTFWTLTGKENPILNYQCNRKIPVAIVGDALSLSSIAMATVLGTYMYPQISYISSLESLNRRYLYPSFFRTIPSDDKQARALAKLVSYMGWNWVGLLSLDEEYGILGSQIAQYLKKLRFKNRMGEEIYFDSNGNPPTDYDILNWHQNFDSSIDFVKVGRYNIRETLQNELSINVTAIKWITGDLEVCYLKLLFGKPLPPHYPGWGGFNSKKHFMYLNLWLLDSAFLRSSISAPQNGWIYLLVPASLKTVEIPRSVCSDSCSPGFRKAPKKGQPMCCFDCIPCSEGHISNQADSSNCFPCPSEMWPNQNNTLCIPKVIEFLSYWEPLGITLTSTVISCTITTISILFLFVKFKDTAIVKANNRDLTYLLLVSLSLSFLCSLLFIGEPQKFSCQFRQGAFGVIFVLSVSCVLAKTIMVVIAFRATKPGSNMRKWVGPKVPALTVSVSTSIQLFICVYWMIQCPPFPEKNITIKTGVIIFQCNECSDTLLWCMLGYMAFLSCVSFLVAFLARKLPDSFNEAKWITFSMLIFLSVWISFVPAYLSTQGKLMVAVEIFGILSSSAGIVGCFFFPKCFIILLRPELNTRQNLLGKGTAQKKKT